MYANKHHYYRIICKNKMVKYIFIENPLQMIPTLNVVNSNNIDNQQLCLCVCVQDFKSAIKIESKRFNCIELG